MADPFAAYKACESPTERHLVGYLIQRGVPVEAQRPIGRYRADFVVDDGVSRFVIEVDGWEWHRRNPHQWAADMRRDRYMLSQGWPVIRFTAAEVKRDAWGCVDEVIALRDAQKAFRGGA